MAIALKRLHVGMVLYDRHKTGMGNTTLKSIGEWKVEVMELREHGAMVIWNGNRPPVFWSERRLMKLFDWSMYEKCAEVKRGLCDQVISVKLKPMSER